MKRRDEIIVGVTILAAVGLVAAGAIWMADKDVFGARSELYTARFRSVGGLGVGNPVVLRGVRVGRVENIRLAESDMVDADLQVYEGVSLPARPAIIAASASFFGEWQAEIINLDAPPTNDPNVLAEIELVQETTGDETIWPGATLPDIGQLTAQAGRIASDIGTVASRISTAFDSTAVAELQQSIREFGRIADRINSFLETQTDIMGNVGVNLERGSKEFGAAAELMHSSFARVDTATQEGELEVILDNMAAASQQIRGASDELHRVLSTVGANDQSLERLLHGADTVMTRLQDRSGTAGLLLGDSALYLEATLAIVELRSLLADIKANPRKYFKFSVF